MDCISMRIYANKGETSIFLTRYDTKVISLGYFLVKNLFRDIIISFIQAKLIEEPPKDNEEDSEHLGYVFKVTHLFQFMKRILPCYYLLINSVRRINKSHTVRFIFSHQITYMYIFLINYMVDIFS